MSAPITPAWQAPLDRIGAYAPEVAVTVRRAMLSGDPDQAKAALAHLYTAVGAELRETGLDPAIDADGWMVARALHELVERDSVEALSTELVDLFDRTDPAPAEVEQNARDAVSLDAALRQLGGIGHLARTVLADPSHELYRQRCELVSKRLAGWMPEDRRAARDTVLTALNAGAGETR